ncbi:twin-arginine translocase TatA/TatE family subunit, partial [Frankia sp. CiP3]
ARSVGRSLRIFKAETKGLSQDDENPTVTAPPQAQPAPAPRPIEPAPAVAAAQQATAGAPSVNGHSVTAGDSGLQR